MLACHIIPLSRVSTFIALDDVNIDVNDLWVLDTDDEGDLVCADISLSNPQELVKVFTLCNNGVEVKEKVAYRINDMLYIESPNRPTLYT